MADFRSHPHLVGAGPTIKKGPGVDAKAHFAAVHPASFKVGGGAHGRVHIEVVLEGDNQVMIGACHSSFDVVNPSVPQKKKNPALAINPSFTPLGWAYYPFNGGVYHGEPGDQSGGAQGAEAWRSSPHQAGVNIKLRLELDCSTGTLYGAQAPAPGAAPGLLTQMCTGLAGDLSWFVQVQKGSVKVLSLSTFSPPPTPIALFAHKTGALGGGNDVAQGDHTLDEAAQRCLKLGAAGFTHHGAPNPQGKVKCFFKSSQAGNEDPQWQTYLPHIKHKQGALGGGNDIESGEYTLDEAWIRCLQLPAAVGFTHAGAANPQGKVLCYFKSSTAGNADPAWQTYLKAAGAPTLPVPPSKIALFAHKTGALGGGNDVAQGDHTLDEAAQRCLKLGAAGFTHHGAPNPQGKVKCFFKSSQAGNEDPQWQTYLPHIKHKQGALGGGNDIESGEYTLDEAWIRCLQLPAAVGFTHAGAANPQGKVLCYFKSSTAGNADPAWQTYLKNTPAPAAPAPTPLDLAKKILLDVEQLGQPQADPGKRAHWEHHLWNVADGWKRLVAECVDINNRQGRLHGQSAELQQQVSHLLLTSDFEARAKSQFVPPQVVQQHVVFILQQLGTFKSWPQDLQAHYAQTMRKNKAEGWKTLVKDTTAGRSSPAINQQMAGATAPMQKEVIDVLFASDFEQRVKEQMPQLHFEYKVGALGGGNDVHSGEFTLEEACVKCSALPNCVGFTYHGKADQQGKLLCYFKSSPAGNADPAWQTYLKTAGTPQLIPTEEAAKREVTPPLPAWASALATGVAVVAIGAGVALSLAAEGQQQRVPEPQPEPQPQQGGGKGLGAVPAGQPAFPGVVMASAVQAPADASALLAFLTAHRLAGYTDALLELGAEEPLDLADLEDEDYDSIGMKKLERNRLHKALQEGGVATPEHQEPARRESRRARRHERRGARGGGGGGGRGRGRGHHR